jgi:hypothetical protein
MTTCFGLVAIITPISSTAQTLTDKHICSGARFGSSTTGCIVVLLYLVPNSSACCCSVPCMQSPCLLAC